MYKYLRNRDLGTSGEKVTHIAHELEMLAEAFGKKFTVTPTLNRKKVATAVGLNGSEMDVPVNLLTRVYSI